MTRTMLSMIGVLWIYQITLIAQDAPRQYDTQTYNAEWQSKDASYLDAYVAQEEFIANHVRSNQSADIQISLVFHFMSTVDTSDVINAVSFQLDALNGHFSLAQTIADHPADPEGVFASIAVNTQIQFCLADASMIGMDTIHGVKTIEQKSITWTDRNSVHRESDGGTAPFSAGSLINVWVVDLPTEYHSFAQMPLGAIGTDGIVIDSKYFGQGSGEYDQGKTLTHLVGSYLGLNELWSQDFCKDDRVSDTPVHNSPNYSCTDANHVTACKPHVSEMSMNFMDATPDTCQYMFSYGQKMRMQAILSEGGARHGLTLNDNCHE